jgi:hypothetical protein
MTKNLKFRRLILASVISVGVNLVWLGLDIVLTSQKYPSGRLRKIVETLGTPGGDFGDWVGPKGHDVGPFLSTFLITIVSSWLFYAVVAWLGLTGVSWLRTKTLTKNTENSPL